MALDEEVIFLINAYRAMKNSTGPVPTNKMRTITGGQTKPVSGKEYETKMAFRAKIRKLALEKQVSNEALVIVSAIYGVPDEIEKTGLKKMIPVSIANNGSSFKLTEETEGDGCHTGIKTATRKTRLALYEFLKNQFEPTAEAINETIERYIKTTPKTFNDGCGGGRTVSRGC